jgi:hypothetical protein
VPSARLLYGIARTSAGIAAGDDTLASPRQRYRSIGHTGIPEMMVRMGEEDSSLARVQPVFNALLDRWPDGEPWLGELWTLAADTRPEALPKPRAMGKLVPLETPPDRPSRRGKVFERTVAPPIDFLRWLLAHPEAMQLRDPIDFGAKSDVSREWRRKLFSQQAPLVTEARAEAERQLAKRASLRGRQKWWAFEGFSRVDCCLITDRCVIFVEGKRTDIVSPSTRWFAQRSQLWRNVEAAKEFAGDKQFGVILAVESEADGVAALHAAAESLTASYPHLPPDQQVALGQHLLGFVTWSSIVTRFGIPEVR